MVSRFSWPLPYSVVSQPPILEMLSNTFHSAPLVTVDRSLVQHSCQTEQPERDEGIMALDCALSGLLWKCLSKISKFEISLNLQFPQKWLLTFQDVVFIVSNSLSMHFHLDWLLSDIIKQPNFKIETGENIYLRFPINLDCPFYH